MTDNEKAATFIGWNCDPHSGPWALDQNGHIFPKQKWWCSTCDSVWDVQKEHHSQDCPDMSDSRNYMRALILGVDDWMYNRGVWSVRKGTNWRTGNLPKFALSALYDAEHEA